MSARIDKIVTSGQFKLDGGSWDVDNNVWLVGDDSEVLVIDAAHDAEAIQRAIGDRRLTAIACTHGHNDHINAAAELADRTGAPILLHPEDRVLWDMTYPDRKPDELLTEGEVLTVAGTGLRILHTPGHAPGAVCLYAPELGALFSGDTLFQGGPGATGRSYSDFNVIIESIRDSLLSLSPDVTVHTGHGDSTSIGAEAPQLDEWIKRGH
ncbi:glyoxylase-like metal-dependent hydrolase (beta-lactamase superfamily II) [Tamaricihabitans halophyticus]|uniref:Glyoxylase-like metal-dependent hydrolase (Beta-lactamase superfamily II) n=1 Tax=Tamaricihabitans halophyticus TaxID=1262583 RepID=A0A4R2QZP4_9PSEU|nr:MBL fold metallo-hydrolase [Tamaricihabitans halophyticus]TCP54864.1 glyoxylase-like metal-dependent hydrolase (beta-lactamase superfamily II) [Tamaricihabitans halophyticus]